MGGLSCKGERRGWQSAHAVPRPRRHLPQCPHDQDELRGFQGRVPREGYRRVPHAPPVQGRRDVLPLRGQAGRYGSAPVDREDREDEVVRVGCAPRVLREGLQRERPPAGTSSAWPSRAHRRRWRPELEHEDDKRVSSGEAPILLRPRRREIPPQGLGQHARRRDEALRPARRKEFCDHGLPPGLGSRHEGGQHCRQQGHDGLPDQPPEAAQHAEGGRRPPGAVPLRHRAVLHSGYAKREEVVRFPHIAASHARRVVRCDALGSESFTGVTQLHSPATC
mmetsp:Transcript_43138/g.112266  ORF Transcript_43138/g.112266 Transcript_43138/m.112266 type:complete len:279 (+) Transcript_43138:615-1451(+)